jgi:hypothetical protein
MIRAGIRAVKKSEAFDHPTLHNGAVIPTFSHDRVVRGIAPAATPEADRQLMREVARDVVKQSVKSGLEAV